MGSGQREPFPGPDGVLLGLGGSGHDWSACAAGPGGLCAIEEERLARKKYGVGADLLAGASRQRALAGARADPASVSHVVACELVPRSFTHFARRKVEIIGHHLAHAYCAFGASPFREAAILVCDNAGGVVDGAREGRERLVETISYFRADRDGIHLLDRVTGVHRLQVASEGDYYRPGETDNSLGHLYRTASLRLGLRFQPGGGYEDISEDGKTMGLAPYGDGRWDDAVGELVQLLPGGQIAIDAARAQRALHALEVKGDLEAGAALAHAAQRRLEAALLHCVEHLHRLTGLEDLCLVGGVALNSVANGVIARSSPFRRVFVPPAPGDNGISLGAVYYALHRRAGVPLDRLPPLRDAFLGPEHAADEADAALEAWGLTPSSGDLVVNVARALADGAVIGWWEGRSEFGPRALGHRSILAAPFPGEMRDRLNRDIKHREWFRPYAAVVAEERCGQYFDFRGASPFMSFVAQVKRPDAIPALTHVDGSCRVQTLEPGVSSTSTLGALLEAFEGITGVPVLLNTSFNAAGEPIVETAQDAIRAYQRMGLDGLVLGRRLVLRPRRGGGG
jgi:carbamoyltransferase